VNESGSKVEADIGKEDCVGGVVDQREEENPAFVVPDLVKAEAQGNA
jgi:hypothetical protein